MEAATMADEAADRAYLSFAAKERSTEETAKSMLLDAGVFDCARAIMYRAGAEHCVSRRIFIAFKNRRSEKDVDVRTYGRKVVAFWKVVRGFGFVEVEWEMEMGSGVYHSTEYAPNAVCQFVLSAAFADLFEASAPGIPPWRSWSARRRRRARRGNRRSSRRRRRRE